MGRKGRKHKERRRTQTMCVYCGDMAICTEEHVIPQGLFNKDAPPPKNYVKIQVCQPCNSRKARDDSYIRDIFVSDVANTGNPLAEPVLNGQVHRSIQKNWSD